MPTNITDDKRKSPEISELDETTKQYFKNMGYKDMEVPPGFDVGNNEVVESTGKDRAAFKGDDKESSPSVNLENTGTQNRKVNDESKNKQGIIYAKDMYKRGYGNDPNEVSEAMMNQKNEAVGQTQNTDSGETGNEDTQNVAVSDDQDKVNQMDADRQVQSAADKVRSESDKVINDLKEQVNSQNIQMQTMMSVVQGNQQVKNQPSQKEPGQPKLQDYVSDLGDDFDQAEILDTRTKSGRAYTKFMDDRDQWLRQDILQKTQANINNNQQNEIVMGRARDFANANPEYKNFDGTPNTEKIQNFLASAASSDWVKLKVALDTVNKGDAYLKSVNTKSIDQDLEINRAANKSDVQAIGNSGSKASERVETNQNNSDAVAYLEKTFGSHFEIPDGVEVI